MIPLATTTIDVYGRSPQEEIDPDAEGYDTPDPTDTPLVASAVRASITLPRGSRQGQQETDTYKLRADLTDSTNAAYKLDRFMTVVDRSSGQSFYVVTVSESYPTAYGLQHYIADLKLVKGLPTNEVVVGP